MQSLRCRQRKGLTAGAVPKVSPHWSSSEEEGPASKAVRRKNDSKRNDSQISIDTECASSGVCSEPEDAGNEQRLHKKRAIKKLDVKQWQQEHDYSSRNYAYFTGEERLEAATHYIQDLQARILDLRAQRFGLERFSSDPELVGFYTGFPSYECVQAAFLALQPTAERMAQCTSDQCRIRGPDCVIHQAFCHQNLALIDQFFLFLVKVKQGSIDQDLAFRFGVSVSCVGQVILTWANYMYILLGAMPIWPSRSQVDASMPACFKALCRNTRVILHPVELKIEKPSTISSYLRRNPVSKGIITCKGLIGITPAGGVSFISTLYTSPISNRALTVSSQISRLLEPGDQVMVDKGFPIQMELSKIGASLVPVPVPGNMPRSNLSYRVETQYIERLRRNIEHDLQRVSEYHIFDKPIPLARANQIWTVCCLLTNFKGPLRHGVDYSTVDCD